MTADSHQEVIHISLFRFCVCRMSVRYGAVNVEIINLNQLQPYTCWGIMHFIALPLLMPTGAAMSPLTTVICLVLLISSIRQGNFFYQRELVHLMVKMSNEIVNMLQFMVHN